MVLNYLPVRRTGLEPRTSRPQSDIRVTQRPATHTFEPRLGQGGELFYRLKREGRFSVERVRLYGAEIASGLGAPWDWVANLLYAPHPTCP